MTDPKRPTPAESPTFETGPVQSDRAREQGLGPGDRERKAQRDPGGVRTANEETDIEGASDASDGDALDQSVGRTPEPGAARTGGGI